MIFCNDEWSEDGKTRNRLDPISITILPRFLIDNQFCLRTLALTSFQFDMAFANMFNQTVLRIVYLIASLPFTLKVGRTAYFIAVVFVVTFKVFSLKLFAIRQANQIRGAQKRIVF